ncbi:MAG: ribonuclease III [Clostridiales bacterium]|jgi:ribonuclease-3 family protein|nr:ribonuclease III [Clostridiales bacterium]
MRDFFHIQMTDAELSTISVLGLAHIGDAVYELLTRTALCARGKCTSKTLHRDTVKRVCAPAQALAMQKLTDILNDEEQSVFKRGRNAKVNSVPKSASVSDYHTATGLETLFGYLYLKGRYDRINELFEIILED